MVCFRYVIVRTLHKGGDKDNNNNNNNNGPLLQQSAILAVQVTVADVSVVPASAARPFSAAD